MATTRVLANTLVVNDWVLRPRNNGGTTAPESFYWDQITAITIGSRVTVTTADQDDGDDAAWATTAYVLKQ